MTEPENARQVAHHNFVLNIAEGSLYIAAASFVSVQTVLPALIVRLGGDNFSIGLLGTISWFGLFLPQIFAARYVETHPWKKPWAVWAGLIQRTFILLIGCAIVLFGTSSPATALPLFLVLFGLNQVALGIATPGWFDMFAKLTPLRKRGRLVGIRNSIAGVGAFGCGLVLTWLLADVPFPRNYAYAFFFAWAMQMASIIIQTQLVELEPSIVSERRPFFAYLKTLPSVLGRNRQFKLFVGASAFQILATMPVGFFTAYAIKTFGARGALIGQFTLMIVAVQIISAVVNGFVADRYGNKTALVIAAIAMMCASLAALCAPSLGWFFLVYFFLGINIGTEISARYNMSIEFGTEEQPSLYIGLMNTMLAPLYLSALLGGWLSDTYGYAVVFVAGILFSLMSLFMLVVRVREPRIVSA